jgi:hypothetical protein
MSKPAQKPMPLPDIAPNPLGPVPSPHGIFIYLLFILNIYSLFIMNIYSLVFIKVAIGRALFKKCKN